MTEYRGVSLDGHSSLKEYIRYLQHVQYVQYGDEAVVVRLRKKRAS